MATDGTGITLEVSFTKSWDETRNKPARSHWFVFCPTENAGARWHAVYANLVARKSLLRNAANENIAPVIAGLRSGLPLSAFSRAAELIGVRTPELSKLVRVSPRTLSRRDSLNPSESECLFRLTTLFQRALEVLGDKLEARRWFTSPKKALGGRSPMEYADTEIGAREVEDLLGRLEHGVFS